MGDCYTKFYVLVFKCKWIDNKSGVRKDESIMIIDFWKIGYRNSHSSWHIKPPKFLCKKSYVTTLVCCSSREKTNGC